MLLPRSANPHPCTSPAPHVARRRPRGGPAVTTAAVAAVAALVFGPAPVHGAGGLRGGGAVARDGPRRRREGRARGRGLAAEDAAVAIDPFSTDLLATNFPAQLKYQTEHELSGAVSRHVASYLQSVLDEKLSGLGLECAKHEEPIGPEVRWRLTCEGAALFEDAPPRARPSEVNAAVRGAFAGEAKSQFLEQMYPRYEMIRERREWGAERERRRKNENKTKKKDGTRKKRKKKPSNRDKNSQKKKKTSQSGSQSRGKGKGSQMNKKEQMTPNMGGGPHFPSDDGELNVVGYIFGSQGRPGKNKKSQKKENNVSVSKDKNGSKKSKKPGQEPGSSDDASGSRSRGKGKGKGSQNNKKEQMTLNVGGGPQRPFDDGELNLVGDISGSQGRPGKNKKSQKKENNASVSKDKNGSKKSKKPGQELGSSDDASGSRSRGKGKGSQMNKKEQMTLNMGGGPQRPSDDGELNVVGDISGSQGRPGKNKKSQKK